MKRAILVLFSTLFFGIPLIFFPRTSELFEFNKIVMLYAVTLGILFCWVVECILEKKVILKRTILDIPLLIFLGSQILSTFFSMDQRSSIFGYYSRFNGGLISIICYLILYWAFVTHVSRKDIPRLFLNLTISSVIAAIWGVLEHFGKSPSCALITGNFDVGCWVQDVQLRVFATFGQPNWMAAWMAAITPLMAALTFNILSTTEKVKINFLGEQKNKGVFLTLSLVLSGLFFAALLFTKSKSGVGSFGVSVAVFVSLIFLMHFSDFKKQFSKAVFAVPLVFVIIIAVFGSPWTPTIFNLASKTESASTAAPQTGTALETGGTDSGIIRYIVWRGAINVWRQYPVIGSGVETFAFSYYRGRPMSHNLVSEWNFLYNKAHNEYLNYLATTGIVGLLSYLGVISFSLLSMLKVLQNQKKSSDFYITAALFSGYVSLLITNFFGFSVVPTSILFYLFPAFAITLLSELPKETKFKNPEGIQIFGIAIVSIVSLYGFLMLFNYWHADYLYAQAQQAQNDADYSQSLKLYSSAIDLEPNESLYHAQLGSLYADLTTAKEADAKLIETFTTASLKELETAQKLSSENIRIFKSVANSYATLGDKDSQYLLKTLEITQRLKVMAPTDPSVLYQQCLTLAKLEHIEEAITTCETAIEMKPDYKIARRLSAYLYEQTKQPSKARVHLEYILKNISPDDVAVQKELQSLPLK